MKKTLAMVACFFLLGTVHAQTKQIHPAEAKNHIGELATVCGKVVSTRYASKSKGQPTFLNLDEPFPKQVFTILIWRSDRDKFGSPESKYRGAPVCVTGKITSYQGEAEIIVTDPEQLAVQSEH